jgi:hypothetical protein
MKRLLAVVVGLLLFCGAVYAWDSDSGWQPTLSTELGNLAQPINSTQPINTTSTLQVGTSPNPSLFVTAGRTVGIGNTQSTVLLQAGTSPTMPALYVREAAYDFGGSIGIGMTPTGYKLDIRSGPNAAGSDINFYENATRNAWIGWEPAGDEFRIDTAGYNKVITFNSGKNGMALSTTGNLSLGRTASNQARLWVVGKIDSSPTEKVFLVSDSTPTGRLIVLGNGNVGIGTTVPSALVQIQSSTSEPSGSLFLKGGLLYRWIIGNSCAKDSLTVGAGGTITQQQLYVDCTGW